MSANVRTSPSAFKGQDSGSNNNYRQVKYLQEQGYYPEDARRIIKIAGAEQVIPAMEWLLKKREELMDEDLSFRSAEAVLKTSIGMVLKWNHHPEEIVSEFEYYCIEKGGCAPLSEYSAEESTLAIRGMLMMLQFGLPLPLQGKVGKPLSSARPFLFSIMCEV